MLENDWHASKFNQVSGLMVYARIYGIKRSERIKCGMGASSKRWRRFVEVFSSMFDLGGLDVDQWGNPIILRNASEKLEPFSH